MMRHSRKIHNLLNKGSTEPVHPVVLSLAPNIPENRDSYLVYKSYLDTALNDNSIQNIAITGNYGIGKSSFLKWYTGKKKYLFVSLCDFSRGNGEKDINELGSDICRQLLIGCSKAQKRRKKWHFIGICILTFLICTFITYYLLLNNTFGSFDSFNVILDKLPWFHRVTSDEILSIKFVFDLIGGIASLLGIPLLIAWLVSAISVSKISFKAKDIEAEMELERNKDAHFVDLFKVKLVDELRKAARQYDYTVIFEDFDRTGYDNCISLFTDLREINRLINYSTSKFGKKHPVRFIYILQDDLFAASKRADGPNRMARSLQLKFFDFIIPFIPEIYGNASAEYIYKCLKAADVRDESCHEFIETTGNCLYDYRTIHNIANEYQIIKSIYLGTNEMKSNKQSENQVAKKDGNAVDDSRVDKKILALAAYKTLMPDDYARIRTGESLLFDIGFESLKDSMIDPCVRSLWEHQWLDGTCLEFVGLNAHVINRYISRIISAETGKASPDLVHWIEHIYPLWRRALLEDADSLDKILKKYAYTLLCLELENSSPDFTLIQKAFDREMNMTEEDFGAGGFDNKIYKLMQKARECPNLVVQYLLRFNCSEWSWLFTSNLPVKQFGMCISLPDNEKQKLFEAAKGPIAEYINGLEGEQLKELINSIDLKDAELIGKLSINPEIKVAIEKGPYYGGRR